MPLRIVSLIRLLFLMQATLASAQTHGSPIPPLVYFDAALLARSKAAIKAGDPGFLEPYHALLAECNTLFEIEPDPVVNKSQIPPSGDRQDYLSYAPYRWPDESKADGLPWIPRDGIVNPIARGPDTDHQRLQTMLTAVEKLSFAFYFSDDRRYADQTLEHLNAWFIAPETRVNPHVLYAQSIPGLQPGNPAAFIDWRRFYSVLTAVQLLHQAGVFPDDAKQSMDTWLAAYLDYMVTSEQGQKTDALPQNHATWYNCQVVGLMLYLGRIDEAKAKVIETQTTRIATQILPSGQQPKETGRTRSMHYVSMNLWGLANLTFMGRQIGIDLWGFETPDGRSLPQAYRYLEPFALHEDPWPFLQIDRPGEVPVIHTELRPLFTKTSALLDLDLYAWSSAPGNVPLPPLEALQFPVSREP